MEYTVLPPRSWRNNQEGWEERHCREAARRIVEDARRQAELDMYRNRPRNI